MQETLNHNSFLLAGLLLEILAAAAILQRGRSRRHWALLAAVTLTILTAFFLFRPAVTSGTQLAEIEAHIGQGTPVLLEIKSPN